jgi:4-amino-4-deoxy-L-arabinose transferase-like glycosyltransferase
MKARRPRWAALLLLMLLYAQLTGAAAQLSATVDEGFHITSGYEYLRTGSVRLFDEHAPVAKALFAWPLFFVRDLSPPESSDGYASGDLIAVAQATTLSYRPLDRVIVAPRLAAILVTLLLAATLYRCAAALAGPAAGLLALTLLTFDPNFLAHGSLATTDMGATAFSFWAVWAGARWLQQPTHRRWWATALLLGLAQGTKLTALLVYPVLGLGAIVSATMRRRRGENWHTPLVAYAAMVGISLLALWALYGFELRAVPGVLRATPLPAASHVERWLRLRENLAYGRESFLLGQNAMHGWLLYFPVAFLVKTPLPTLMLLGASLVGGVLSLVRHFRFRLAWVTFGLFPLLYALASLASTLNIGYRHLLPVLPFLYVAASAALAKPVVSLRSENLLRSSRIAGYALLLWLALGTASSAPHYLTYFNELAGGADNGWRFLADSNTDWGQTFKALAAHQASHALGPVRLSAFTFYDPGAYGVNYTPIAPMPGPPPVLPQRFNPEPGIYALSATTLDGVPLAYPPTFDWFRHREPFVRVGHAMFLYDVQTLPGRWVAQCSTPVAPLPALAVDEGFGIPDLRQVDFDCEESWVLPHGGIEAGWITRAIPEQTRLRWPIIDPAGAAVLPPWVAALPLEGLSLSYLQPRNGELPAFAVWECAACGLATPQAPFELSETVAFLGLTAPSSARPGSTVEVATFWQVLTPSPRPLSIMLHLRNADNVAIAVGDGLGFPVEGWQPGDQFVQRHRLSIPAETGPGDYALHTAAYWLEDLSPLSTEALVVPLEIRAKP